MLAKLSVKNLTRGKLCVFACFPAGTPVAVRYRNIEEIQAGDEIWAWDETSGELGLKKVLSTLQREVHALVELTIAGETIYTTPEHPFLVNGAWKEAGLLDIHDKVQLFTSRQARVESIKYTGAYSEAEILQVNEYQEVLDIGSADTENITVYNLEVEGFGTYFVGWLKALVHNSTKTACAKGAIDKFRRSMSERKKALLRDAVDPNSGLSQKARDFITKHKGDKVPKGHEVSHEVPLYNARTVAGKRKLDKAKNMKTQQKAAHRRRHKQCGDQFHKFGASSKPKFFVD